MIVRYHRLAARELREARAWYEARRIGTGDEFRTEVAEAIQRIVDAPERSAPYRVHYRSVRLQRFPYRVYYAILGPAHILIMAVAHDRRRPGYWLRRSAN
jgi:plasmid stabilization system protein ParE